MLVVQISVNKSGTLSAKEKRTFHLLFSFIAAASFCEWLGVCLQNAGEHTRIIHIAVKATELSMAPFIAVFIAWIIDGKIFRPIFAILGFHALLELLSGFFGFIYCVDGNSFYFHAKYYWIYIASYLISILYAVIVVVKNVKKYQYTGVLYFAASVLFLICGIVTQSVDSELRVDYAVMSTASIMLYTFDLEMIQQTDKLTELINRRGYENSIKSLDVPCVIIFFDIDRFKAINDTFGHVCGDECLRVTGKTIKNVYARYGKCFRFGGDEFCVIQTKNISETDKLNGIFLNAMANTKISGDYTPRVSLGYAAFNPESDYINDKIEEADRMMYRFKEEHR